MKKPAIEEGILDYKEIAKLNSRNKELLTSVKEADKINSILISRIEKLEHRIEEVNNNKANRLARVFHKIKFITSSVGSGKGVVGKVLFFLSPLGLKLILKILIKGFCFVFQKNKNQFSRTNSKKDPYSIWCEENLPNAAKLREYKLRQASFEYQPKISVIIPVSNVKAANLLAAIDSVCKQVYFNWECIIAIDKETYNLLLSDFQENNLLYNLRISYKVSPQVSDKVSLINYGLKSISGEFCHILSENDLLTSDSLYQFVDALNLNKEAELLYGDEDFIKSGEFVHPNFKPDYNPDHLLSTNYIGKSVLFKSSMLKNMDGLNSSFGNSSLYDAIIRATEKTEHIVHIDKILYHNTYKKQISRIEDHVSDLNVLKETIKRRNIQASVKTTGLKSFSVRYRILEHKKVSILIPSKDKAQVLDKCLESIFEKTTYSNFEVVLIDNNSVEESTFDLFDSYKKAYPDQFFYHQYSEPFNFAQMNNYGVQYCTGDYIVFLNNDTEIISEDWIQGLMEYAQRDSIGAVGAKLFYPDGKIQHAGMVIGLEYGGNTFVGEEGYASGYQNYLNQIRNYSSVTAACMMVRKELFLDFGGFDETFAIEYNDTDFCLRLKEQGYNNVFIPHVTLYHYESLSRGYSHLSKKALKVHHREMEAFTTRWQKYIAHDPCYNRNLSKSKGGFGI
jgi:GT2 family glycosyltransferase